MFSVHRRFQAASSHWQRVRSPCKGKIWFYNIFQLLMNFIYIILFHCRLFARLFVRTFPVCFFFSCRLCYRSFFICQASNKTECFQCQFQIDLKNIDEWNLDSISFVEAVDFFFGCYFSCYAHENNLSSFHPERVFLSILFICDVTDQLNLALIELTFEPVSQPTSQPAFGCELSRIDEFCFAQVH